MRIDFLNKIGFDDSDITSFVINGYNIELNILLWDDVNIKIIFCDILLYDYETSDLGFYPYELTGVDKDKLLDNSLINAEKYRLFIAEDFQDNRYITILAKSYKISTDNQVIKLLYPELLNNNLCLEI